MYGRVLVGTDGSATATRAVEGAAIVAQAHGAELIVAHAFSSRETSPSLRHGDVPEDVRWRLTPGAVAEAVVANAIERALAATRADLPVRGRCAPGHPVAVLLDLVDELDPDVLVVGNRDLHGWVRRHRSVARGLLRRAACDVTVIDTIGRRGARTSPARRRVLGWA